MITAILNSNGYNPKGNSANYNSSNEARKANNSSRVIDSFANSKQVSFEGNLAKVGKNLLGDAGSKIGGKVRRLGEEIMEAASGAFRKLSWKNELPIAEKPAVAAVESHWTTNSKNLLGKLDDKGIYVGDIPADRVGGIPSSYKPGIEHAIDKAVADGKITDATGDSLKSDLRFCGKDGAGDISGTTLGDDVGRGYDGGGVDGGDFDSSDLDFDSLLSFLGS